MDYENLRKFQRIERNSSKLTAVGDEFYNELADLINSAKKDYNTSGSTNDLRQLENILKVARDIFERREQKLIMKALRCTRTNEVKEDCFANGEKDVFDCMMASLKGRREYFDNVLMGEKTVSQAKIDKQKEAILSEKIPSVGSVEEKKPEQAVASNVLVRIVRNVPKFVSSDLKEYGPFECKDVVKLPNQEADLLFKRGFVERM